MAWTLFLFEISCSIEMQDNVRDDDLIEIKVFSFSVKRLCDILNHLDINNIFSNNLDIL